MMQAERDAVEAARADAEEQRARAEAASASVGRVCDRMAEADKSDGMEQMRAPASSYSTKRCAFVDDLQKDSNTNDSAQTKELRERVEAMKKRLDDLGKKPDPKKE